MTLAISVLAVLVLLNGVFAMSELAMMTSRRSRLQQAAAAGHRGAAAAVKLSDEPTRFLSTVQVAITLIGIASGAFAEKSIATHVEALVARTGLPEQHTGLAAMILVVVVLTYFSLIFGELVPKRLAIAYPEAVASAISRPLAAISAIAALPVRGLTASTELVLRFLRVPASTDDVSEEDVRSLMGRAATLGVFTREEHALLQRTMHVGDLMVSDIMVPRGDVVWIDESAGADSVHELAGSSRYSHFPVCRGGFDDIRGVVHIKDLIARGMLAGRAFPVVEVAQPPLFVPETMPVLKLMDVFKRGQGHIAFVVDEYGAPQGLLTLNDVVTALIGDIARGQSDATPRAVQRQDGSWLLDARMPVREAVRTLGLSIPDDDDQPEARTVAGLILARLGEIPRTGDSTIWQGWRFEVVDMDGLRIDQVLAAPAHAPDPLGE